MLGLTKAAVLGSDVNIVGGSLNQSINIHNVMRNAWESDNAPKYLVKEETATRIRLTNKAVIMPLTASQKTVRGPHPPSLLLDEIDEMDLAIFDASLGQPMPQENWQGHIIEPMTAMTSHLAVPGQDLRGGAGPVQRAGREDLPLVLQGHRQPDRRLADREDHRPEEAPRSQPRCGGWSTTWVSRPSATVLSTQTAVERMFSLPEDTIRADVAKERQKYRFEDPKQDREYVIGADWAQAVDWTVISVADVTFLPAKVVHWSRMRRLPYPVMIGEFNKLMKEYNAEGIHDATGLGAVVADYIDRRARGFQMTGAQRDNMLSEYVRAIENDKWRAPRVPVFYKNHLYASVEMLYARGKEYHLPDEICSMALCWRLVSKRAMPAHPIMIPGIDGPTWIEDEMKENRDAKRPAKGWVTGSVQNKSKQVSEEMDLMV